MTAVVAALKERWRSAVTGVAGSFNWTLAQRLGSAIVFGCFSLLKNMLSLLRCELLRGRNVSRYKQFETSPEIIQQELRPAVPISKTAKKLRNWLPYTEEHRLLVTHYLRGTLKSRQRHSRNWKMYIANVTRLYLRNMDVWVNPERLQMVKNAAVDVGPSETDTWPLHRTS